MRAPRLVGAGGIVVGVVVAALMVYQTSVMWRSGGDVRHLKKELEGLRRLEVQLKTQQQALKVQSMELAQKKEELEARRDVLKKAQQPEVPLSAILTELVEALPAQVGITKLNFAGEVLKIGGVSKDTPSVSGFMAALDESRRFRDTKFAYTQRAERTEGEFSFEISTTPIFEKVRESS